MLFSETSPSGYTNHHTIFFPTNRERMRSNSGEYRLEMGQSGRTKIKTVAIEFDTENGSTSTSSESVNSAGFGASQRPGSDTNRKTMKTIIARFICLTGSDGPAFGDLREQPDRLGLAQARAGNAFSLPQGDLLLGRSNQVRRMLLRMSDHA